MRRSERFWRIALPRLALAAMLAAGLGGCGVADLIMGKDKEKKPEIPIPKEIAMKPPAEAKLQVTFTASPLINPDLDGRPSPVVVRLYQLATAEAFQQADFLGLYEKDDKALGKSLLSKAEIIIEPGGIKGVASAVNPETSFIGVVVGFRKFEEAKWRALFPLQGEKRTALRATLLRLSAELHPEEN